MKNVLEQPLVSIITPVYGVEDYIEACLNSIEEQSYQNLECILVNDCTKDRSMERIISFLHDKSKRPEIFKIISHKQNEGLSTARNTGMQNAKGEYIYYLDSDDYISPDCIEGMVKLAKYYKVDIVFGGIERINSDNTHVYMPFNMEERVYQREEILTFYAMQILYTEAPNKLISRDYLTKYDLFFMPGMLHEDVNWTFRLLAPSFKGALYDKPTYFYIQRGGSIMSRMTEKNYNAQMKNLYLINDTVKKYKLEKDKAYISYFQYMIDYTMWLLFYRKSSIGERLRLYKKLRKTGVDFSYVLDYCNKTVSFKTYHFYCKKNTSFAFFLFEAYNIKRRLMGRLHLL